MSRCPTCRFSNEDQAKVCIRCHTPLKKRRVNKVQLSVPEQKPIQRNPSPNVSPDTQRQLQSESKQELLVRLKKRISRYIPDGLTVEDALSRVVVPQKTSQDDTVFIEKNIFSPANLFF